MGRMFLIYFWCFPTNYKLNECRDHAHLFYISQLPTTVCGIYICGTHIKINMYTKLLIPNILLDCFEGLKTQEAVFFKLTMNINGYS